MNEPPIIYSSDDIEFITRMLLVAFASLALRLISIGQEYFNDGSYKYHGLWGLAFDTLKTASAAAGVLVILSIAGIAKNNIGMEYLTALAVANAGPKAIAVVMGWYNKSTANGRDNGKTE